MEYTSFEGMAFTDEDIERWAKDAEVGFPDSELTWGKGRAWEDLREAAEAFAAENWDEQAKEFEDGTWDTSDLIRRGPFEKNSDPTPHANNKGGG